MPDQNSYDRIIESIFFAHFTKGDRQVEFNRSAIADAAQQVGVKEPKNLGDVVYTFRYRRKLPDRVRANAPKGTVWIIRPAGTAVYRFTAVKLATIEPTQGLAAEPPSHHS